MYKPGLSFRDENTYVKFTTTTLNEYRDEKSSNTPPN